MLGDLVEKALEIVGVTPDLVEPMLGGPCGCEERKEQLNALDAWARRVVAGKVEGAMKYLRNILLQK